MSAAEEISPAPPPMPQRRVDQERASLRAASDRLTQPHLKMALILASERQAHQAARAYERAGALTREVDLVLREALPEELPALATIARGLAELDACRRGDG